MVLLVMSLSMITEQVNRKISCREYSPAEKLAILRYHRGVKLKENHTYQDTPDMTAEQIAYRQTLRDITDDYTSMDDVVFTKPWPTKRNRKRYFNFKN